jgi:sugar lactone lactonase YvrE
MTNGITTGPAVVRGARRAVLGEGARWDPRTGALLWVDITGGTLFVEDVDAAGEAVPAGRWEVTTTLGAVVPVDDHDGWLLAAGRGFFHLRPDGSVREVRGVVPEGHRMNDAAADPAGRVFAGSLDVDAAVGAGRLWCLERDGTVSCVLTGLTIPNGIGWSPDGAVMYVVDSLAPAVFAYDYEPATGALGRRRTFAAYGPGEGLPDGLTVDADGGVWVAVYDGARVERYAPDGRRLGAVEVPERQVTSCCLRGSHDATLWITTATEHWTDEERAARPDAGRLWAAPTAARGVPASPFRPVGDWWPST